jgi:type IV secretory pathway VirB2 component (pilin)
MLPIYVVKGGAFKLAIIVVVVAGGAWLACVRGRWLSLLLLVVVGYKAARTPLYLAIMHFCLLILMK